MPSEELQLVPGILAAVFAYLGWVRMTTQSQQTLQQTLSAEFTHSAIRVGDHRFGIERVVVQEQSSRFIQIRNSVLPYGQFGGTTRLWLNISRTLPDAGYVVVEREFPEYDIINMKLMGDTLVVKFDTVDAQDIWEQIRQFDRILDEIVKEL